MRAKWTKPNHGLHLRTPEGWMYMGWIEPTANGFRVLCCWIEGSGVEYPEDTFFKTYTQAQRALKKCAIVAIIGGYRGVYITFKVKTYET